MRIVGFPGRVISMRLEPSSGISSRSSFLLAGIAICSFLFYGVVGADKTWLLAPGFLLSYAAITMALLKRVGSIGQGGEPQTPNLPLPPAGALFLLFIIYGVGLISNATVPFEAKWTMLFVGGVVGAYWVWGAELTTFKDNRLWLGSLVFVVMLCALYGMIIHFKCPEKVLWAERYTEAYVGRLRSTYICPNHFAHLMQMLLPFCLVLLFIPQAGLYLKILAGYSFLVFLPPLYFTESRAGWLGGIVAVGVTICLLALRRSKKLFVLLAVLVPLCSTLLFFGAWRYSETFQRRMQPVVTFLEGQAEDGVGSEAQDFRPQTWMDTIDMIKQQPLIGFGPGNYRYTFPEHRSRFRGVRLVTGHPHNEYLELMADYGLIGFGLFSLAWIYGLVWVLIKSFKAEAARHAFMGMAFLGTAAGTMVHSFFDFQLHVYPNALVLAFLAALACGPLATQRAKGKRKNKGREGRRKAGGGSLGDLIKREEKSSKAASEPLVARDQQSEIRNAQRLQPSAPSCVPLWLNKLVMGALAIGFFVGTLFCIQIISSAFIRAMGDRAREEVQNIKAPALRTQHPAARYYELAVRIDPQNWRAYKGMALLLNEERYYTLDRAEKLQRAMTEREWYEKAYKHNSHDPEIVAGLGKSLIFVGKHQEKGSGEEASESPQSPASNVLLDQGLALLREACGYRKFNDLYWWTLGVELRKAGRYEEALEIFQYAEKIKRTPSTRKNIRWLEQQMSEDETLEASSKSPKTFNLRLQREEIDLSEVLELMDR